MNNWSPIISLPPPNRKEWLGKKSKPFRWSLIYFTECALMTNLKNTSGWFSSPGFPSNYPNNVECAWTIPIPPGSKIYLTFLEFDVEECGASCSCDYVEVRRIHSQRSCLHYPGATSVQEWVPSAFLFMALVDMIPRKDVIPERVIPERFHHGLFTWARISFTYAISEKHHVLNKEQPLVLVSNTLLSGLERVARASISLVILSRAFNKHYMKSGSHHVNATRNKVVTPVLNLHRRRSSHVNIHCCLEG